MRFHWMWLWLFTIGCLAVHRPAYAVPEFARQYGVSCQTCHSIPPRLNDFGQGFKANNYNWPGANPSAPTSGLKALPVSAVAEFGFEGHRSGEDGTNQYRTLSLLFAGGLQAGQRRGGGYIASVIASTVGEGEKAGNLEKLFVAYPVSGRRGQWTLGAGQCGALMYQCDHNTLIHHPLMAMGGDAAGFSFAEMGPSLRIDYFDHRGQGSADGHYLTVGVPFAGQLCLNRDAQVGAPRGLFAHAFQRWGQDTVGAYAYTHAGSYLGGLMATHQVRSKLYLVGAATAGNGEGNPRCLSLEGEYVMSPRLALTARLEGQNGEQSSTGTITAVTFYPFPDPMLRLTLETMQRKGDRSLALVARGQF